MRFRVRYLIALSASAALLAAGPAASATPPEGELNLVLEAVAGNGNFAVHIERSTMVRNRSTIDFWMFLTGHPRYTSDNWRGDWRQMRIDCQARTRKQGLTYSVDVRGSAQKTNSEGDAQPQPITADSMDESLAQIVCDGRSFNFNLAPVVNVIAATSQGRELLLARYPGN